MLHKIVLTLLLLNILLFPVASLSQLQSSEGQEAENGITIALHTHVVSSDDECCVLQCVNCSCTCTQLVLTLDFFIPVIAALQNKGFYQKKQAAFVSLNHLPEVPPPLI